MLRRRPGPQRHSDGGAGALTLAGARCGEDGLSRGRARYYAASLCLLIQRARHNYAANDLCSCSIGEATRRKAQTHADHGIDFDPAIDKVALEEIEGDDVGFRCAPSLAACMRTLVSRMRILLPLKDAEAPPALAVGPGADAGIRTAAAGASAGFDDEDGKRSALVLAAPASARSLPFSNASHAVVPPAL